MEGIGLNARIIDAAKRAIVSLFHIQTAARQRLVNDLQSICERCDDAYSQLLQRLAPVKAAQQDPLRFASALRDLAADGSTRSAFKPERLCSEIDQLLVDLSSNLAGLKYSVSYSAIDTLRETFKSMGNYDAALYHQYDEFMRSLDGIASQMNAASSETERKDLGQFAAAEIDALEQDLRSSISQMRSAKAAVIHAI